MPREPDTVGILGKIYEFVWLVFHNGVLGLFLIGEPFTAGRILCSTREGQPEDGVQIQVEAEVQNRA